MSILITTYEGTHNHPLPISATAMASTTSAAACMLMSGSSASRPAIGASAVTTPSASASLHGLINFSALSDASGQRQFYLPSPSLSSSPSYPTITLDLTSPPSSSSPSTQFSRFSSNFSSAARYGPTTFNFSASEAPTTPAASWASSGYLSYAAQPYNNKNQLGFLNLGRQPQEQFYQSYLQKAAANAAPMASNSQPLNDTITAATKAITSDPSFQSALAAAITSIVGGQGTHGVAEAPGQINLKWGEQLSAVSPLITSSANGNGCGSTYLTRSMSSNPSPQQSNPTFPPPSLTMSSSKSASASPVHNKEQIN